MMSPFRWVIAFCTALISVSALTFSYHPITYASSKNADERGAVLFQTRGCERCHSITGVGGDRAPDLGSVGLRRKPGQIKAQILRGGNGMPPFKGVLAKDEVEELVKFLGSCRSDTPPGCRQWASPQSPQ
jgi:mono/diheme cytochrome c family protein